MYKNGGFCGIQNTQKSVFGPAAGGAHGSGPLVGWRGDTPSHIPSHQAPNRLWKKMITCSWKLYQRCTFGQGSPYWILEVIWTAELRILTWSAVTGGLRFPNAIVSEIRWWGIRLMACISIELVWWRSFMTWMGEQTFCIGPRTHYSWMCIGGRTSNLHDFQAYLHHAVKWYAYLFSSIDNSNKTLISKSP